MTATTAFHIDSFTSLDDLPRKQHGNPLAVLAALQSAGRFSTFEASEYPRLGSTLTTVLKSNWIERTWGAYPWTFVELSDAGRAALKECG